MQKNRLKFRGLIVGLLVTSLTFTEIPWLTQEAYGDTPVKIAVHQPLAELSLDASLGKIESTTLAKNNPHHVVIIQNAHAVAAAQISIQKILKRLNENYGVKLVTLEGATETLDRLFFKAFPEKKIMNQVLNQYLEKGELAGSAASLLLNSEEMIYEGIESKELYFQNMDAFIEGLKKQASLREKIKNTNIQLEDLKTKYYSAELKKFDRAEEDFQENTLELLAYLAVLKDYRANAKDRSYPLLEDLWKSLEQSDPSFEEQKKIEIETIISQLSSHLDRYAEQKEFYAEKQQYEIERQSPENFLEYLLLLAKRKKVNIQLSEKLKQSLQLHTRLKKLEGQKLFDEMESFVLQVRENLFRSDREKNLHQFSARLNLLKKNISFELSRNDWELILQQKPLVAESTFSEFSKLRDTLSSLEEEVYAQTSPFRKFYELAQKREVVLFQNLKKNLVKHHEKNTAVILGGFHTEGFVELLKKEGFSFHVVVPEITQIEDEKQYVRQMGGDVSWKNFLKVENDQIDVREGFYRAVMREALREKENKSTFREGEFLKTWRDEILREVVRKGRSSRASAYTHFMDDYVMGEFDQSELNNLQQSWSKQVEQFSKKLREVYNTQQFSVEKVSALFHTPALESWVTLLQFTNVSVPSRWQVDFSSELQTSEKERAATSVNDFSARVDLLTQQAEVGRAELRKKIKIDGEAADMSEGFVVKAPASWNTPRDAFIYRKRNPIPLRVDFKPNYEVLEMDVVDHLRKIGGATGTNGLLQWSQKVTAPSKAQKIVIAVPTYDRSNGAEIYSKLEYFDVLARQIEKVKSIKPDWHIELVFNVNGLNQETYLEDLRTFQDTSDISVVILSMPFGGEVEGDPYPGQGNAINFIRQYALRINADIVGLLHDDITFLEENSRGEKIEKDTHLLSNLEFLIEQTRSEKAPFLVSSQSQKEFPNSFWQKILRDPGATSRSNQIGAMEMFAFLDALPPMPSFPVSEDLYLSFYFQDLTDIENPDWRILKNPKSAVSFRKSEKLSSDFRQNYRQSLSDAWLFQLLHGEKRKLIEPRYGAELFLKNWRRVLSPWFWFREVFVNHLVGAELLVRQLLGRPRLTTAEAESVAAESKQRVPLRFGQKSISGRSELRNIKLGAELTSETSFLSDQEVLIFKGNLDFLKSAAAWISETKGKANPFDVFEASKFSIKLRVLKEEIFMQALRDLGAEGDYLSYDSLFTVDFKDTANPDALIRFRRSLLKPESYSALINAVTNTLLIDARHHFETLEDRIAGTYRAEPFLEEQVRVYKTNIEYLEAIAQYAEHLAEQGKSPEQHRKLASDIRTKEITKEEFSLKIYMQSLNRQDPYRFGERAVAYVMGHLDKVAVTWATAYPQFPAEAARRKLAKLPMMTQREISSMQNGLIDQSWMGIPVAGGHKKLTLEDSENFAIEHQAKIRINEWDYQIRENDVLITHMDRDEKYTSTDLGVREWLTLAMQTVIFATMVGAKQTVANRYHEFTPQRITTEKEARFSSAIDRKTREITIANLPAHFNRLKTPKRQALLEAKFAYALAVLSEEKSDRPILRLPHDDEFYDQGPRSELRDSLRSGAKKIADNTAPFTLSMASLYVALTSPFLGWINQKGGLEVWAYGIGGSALIGLALTQVAKSYVARTEDSSTRSELRTEDAERDRYDAMPLEALAKFFNPSESSFIWRTAPGSVVHGVSGAGLPGLVEAKKLLDQHGDEGELSFDYHILRSQKKEGDLFPYILAHLENLPESLHFIKQEIESLKTQSLSQSGYEKIETNKEALAYLDVRLEKIAGVLFEKYFLERDALQLKRYEKILGNKLFRKYLVSYLEKRPNTTLLKVGEEGISLFAVTHEGEHYLVPINVHAVAYPDPEDHNIRKAWTRIIDNAAWDDFLKQIGFQDNGFLYQMMDVQSDQKYRSYRPLDFKNALTFGVHEIQILKAVQSVSLTTMHLARAIQSPQAVDSDIQQFINEVAEKIDSPSALADFLKEISSYKKRDAENIYGKDKVPSIMAFVAFLAPNLLEDMRDWNVKTYSALRKTIDQRSEFFNLSQIQIHHSSRKSIVILSRMRGRERMLLAVPFSYDAVSLHGRIPKVWTNFSGFEKLKLQGGSIYRFKDPIAGRTYPVKHFGSDLLERGHNLGVPVVTDKFDTPEADYPVGFQLLELEHVLLSSGLRPAHDMQVKEINAREFLEIEGEDVAKRRYRSFDDVTDAEIESWKDAGYNTIWMMGIWIESNTSRIINQRWESAEGRGRVASAFSTLDYVLNPRFGNSELFKQYDQAIVNLREVLQRPGDDSEAVREKARQATEIYDQIIGSEESRDAIRTSEEAFRRFVHRAKEKGVRILVDFIPNHLSADSFRIKAQPEMFIHLNHAPNDDMKDFFYPVKISEEKTIWVAHGKDGTPWADTAQLNLENKATWQFFKDTMDRFVKYTDGGGVRIDSLQVLKPEVYWEIWKYQLESKTFEEFAKKLADNVQEVFGKRPEFTNNPFEVVHAYVREKAADFKTIGEVYHGQHPHWQDAGVDVTYAKYSYKWLVDEKDQNWQSFKDHVLRRGPHAGLSAQYLYRSSYLLEDHDERKRVLEALMERLGVSLDEEVKKVTDKSGYYRVSESQEARANMRRELLSELKVDADDIVDRLFEVGLRYWDATEGSEERWQAHNELGSILLEKAITPEIVNWSKLLATMIAVIPGVSLTYDGQEEGKVRLISSADWIPPFSRKNEEVVRPELQKFYRELHQQTSSSVFRRGEVPIRIPLKGVEGGELEQILAFSRTYGHQEAIVVLNHSREKIDVTLDLTHLGFGEKQVSLEAWGSHLEVLTRSELRTSDNAQKESQNLKNLLFHRRTFDVAIRQDVESLLPKPYLQYLATQDHRLDQMGWLAKGYYQATQNGYTVMALHEEPQLHLSLGFPPSRASEITPDMMDFAITLEDGDAGVLKVNSNIKFPSSQGQNTEYDQAPFVFWFKNHLLPFASKHNFSAIEVATSNFAVAELLQEQLKALGFIQKDPATWTSILQAFPSDARSELRSNEALLEAYKEAFSSKKTVEENLPNIRKFAVEFGKVLNINRLTEQKLPSDALDMMTVMIEEFVLVGAAGKITSEFARNILEFTYDSMQTYTLTKNTPEIHRQFIDKSSILQPLLLEVSDELHFRMLLALSISFDVGYGWNGAKKDLQRAAAFSKYATKEASILETMAATMKSDRLVNLIHDTESIKALVAHAEKLLGLFGSEYLAGHEDKEHKEREYKNYHYELALLHMRNRTPESIRRAIEMTDTLVEMDATFLAAHFLGYQLREFYLKKFKSETDQSFGQKYTRELKVKKQAYLKALRAKKDDATDVKGWEALFVAQQHQKNEQINEAFKSYETLIAQTEQFDLSFFARYTLAALRMQKAMQEQYFTDDERLESEGVLAAMFDLFRFIKEHQSTADMREAMAYYILQDIYNQSRYVGQLAINILQHPKLWPTDKELLAEMYAFAYTYGGLSQEGKSILLSNIMDQQFFYSTAQSTDWDGLRIILERAYSLDPLRLRRQLVLTLSRAETFSGGGKALVEKANAYLNEKIQETLSISAAKIHQSLFMSTAIDRAGISLAEESTRIVQMRMDIAEAWLQASKFDMLDAEKRIKAFEAQHVTLKGWKNALPLQFYRIFIRSMTTYLADQTDRDFDPRLVENIKKFVTGFGKRNKDFMEVLNEQAQSLSIHFELGILADAVKDYANSFDQLQRFYQKTLEHVQEGEYASGKISSYSAALEPMITAAVFLQKAEARFHYTQILNRELLYEWNEDRKNSLLDESEEGVKVASALSEKFMEKFEDFQWGAWLYLRSKQSPLHEFMSEFIPFLARAVLKMDDLGKLMAVMNLAAMLGEENLLEQATMRFVEIVPVPEIQVDERLRIADLMGMAYSSLKKRGEINTRIREYINEIARAEEEHEKTKAHEEYLLFFKAKQKFYEGEYVAAAKFLKDAQAMNVGNTDVNSFHLRLALLNLLQGDDQRALADLRQTMALEKEDLKKGWSREVLAERQKTRSIFFFTISKDDQNKMIDLYIKSLLSEPLKAFQMDEIIETLSLLNEDYFYESFLSQVSEAVLNLSEIPQQIVVLFQKINFPAEHLVTVYELLVEMSERFEKSAKNLKKQIEAIEKQFQAEDLIGLAKKSFKAADYQQATRYLELLRRKKIPEDQEAEIKAFEGKVGLAKGLTKQIKDLKRKQGDPTELVGLARQLLVINPADPEALSLAGMSEEFNRIKNLLSEGNISQAKKALRQLLVADKENEKLRRQSGAFDDYDEAIKKVAELLEDKRYQSATEELDGALKKLAQSWDLESIPATETTITKLQERISSQEAEVVLHRNAMLANGSLREVFRHAEDLVNYPEHTDEVYAHLVEAGVKKFEEAIALQSPHEKVKREASFKMAFNYGRLVLEIMSEREPILKYEKAAQSLISQSAAHIWLPKLKNDYFMVASMVEAEEKREIIDREEMGKPVEGPLEFVFSNFEIASNGKTFRLKQFADKQVYDHVWQGDAFKIELQDGTELQPFFRLAAFTSDFLEFEMPETSEAKEEVLKILSQVSKENEGKITRARNSSWIIQRDLLANIVKGLERSTKQKLAFDFKQDGISFESATTGNRLLDQILGLNISLRSAGEKVYRTQQTAIIHSLLDEKAAAEGYDLDPSQREGIIEVLLGVTPFVFLQGPPGTGKTTATVWQTELLMQLKKKIRILSQTNPGADNVVRRLKANGRDVVRVGNNEDAIDPDLLEDWSRRKEALKELATKQGKGEASVIAGTINGLPTDRYLLQWSSLRDADVVETDESSRATRAESILATSWFNQVATKVFVGDHIQLPAHGLTDEDVKFAREYLRRKIKGRTKKTSDPGVDARLNGNQIVLTSSFGERSFEEVFSLPNVKGFKISLMEEALRLYFPNHEDVLSPENFFKVTRPAFFFLDVQRRSGTDIVKLINYFYHGRLKAGRDTRGLVIEDNTEGLYPESRDAQEGDITNGGEVYRVLHWVNDLMNEKKLEAKDIAVISPYKKQVAEIDLALLDFATLHSFLKSFEENGVMEGASEALFALRNSKAIKAWLLEREIQKMKATEARFDFSRAKQRADEKTQVLLTNMQDLAEKPSQQKIKAFREMFGIGENFVTLKDIQEFRLRTLTVDSSIGQEFKAVILSWVRSNIKNGKGNAGNAGFMADPIDGMRRVNVATSRAQDILINIWDRQTFVRNKDADVRNWANHTAKIFDQIRQNPVEWDAETQTVRNEIREASEKETPATKRSELREIVQPALVALASRDDREMVVQAARQLVAGVEQYDLETLLISLRTESRRTRYLRILKFGFDEDQRSMERFEAESRVRSKHRRHDLNLQEYISTYLKEVQADFERRLLDPQDPLKKLNFSFAFEMDDRVETQKMILEYLEMMKALKKLAESHEVQIKTDIRLLVSESLKRDLSPTFRSAVEESRVAHFFELRDNALTEIHMDDYFKKNPQALAYLFSNRGRSRSYATREVHSRFEPLNTLPVTLMMTNFMAAEQIDELSDDYLERLPHRLPFPEAITYNGQNLEITSQALEMIYQIQARQLIATMA